MAVTASKWAREVNSAPWSCPSHCMIHGEPRPESLIVKLRYKQPDGESSKLIKRGVVDDGSTDANTSGDFRFAGAVAGFGMLLRDSPYKGNLTYEAVLKLAEAGAEEDTSGHRREFLNLVRKARSHSL